MLESGWLSCCVKIVSIGVDSSSVVIDGDVSMNKLFSDLTSVDCWARPNELNSCFSLPDDVAVCDSSGNAEVLFGKFNGEGTDFLVTIEFEFGLSRS